MITDKLFEFSLWLDSDWPRYWRIAWTLFALLVCSALFPFRRETRWTRWNHPAVFAGLLLLALLAFRWPALGIAQEFNPDESQLLAGALTMHHQHVFWWLDLTTSGPFSVLPVTVPAWLGWPIDYTSGRWVGVLLAWSTLLCLWRASRHLFGEWIGRVLLLPGASLLVLTIDGSFTQYGSETPPLFYLALALWLLVTAFDPAGRVLSRWRLITGGAILALVPMSKLQAAPLAVVLGAGALIMVLRQKGVAGRSRWRDAAMLLGGAGGTLLVLMLWITASGSLRSFCKSYLAFNLRYAQARAYPWSDYPAQLWSMVKLAWGFPPYLVPTWIMAGWGLVFVRKEANANLLLAAAWVLTAYFVVAAPGREFPHYLLFLVLPSSWFIAVLYGTLIQRTSPVMRVAWGLLVLAVGVWPQVRFYRAYPGNLNHGQLLASQARNPGAVSRAVLALSRPVDTMAVWGWMPVFHVETQLPQATRESHIDRLVTPGPLRDFFRTRYLQDLERRPPDFFLDAVGAGNFIFTDRGVHGHETFPALAAFITARYVLLADVEGTRIYARRDRSSSSDPAP